MSVVIPTLNEAENLPVLLDRLARALDGATLQAEVLVVDDDSPDRTWAVAESLRGRYPALRVLRRTLGIKGLAPAVMEGWRQARGAVLVVMDADLQHPPELIPALVRAIEETPADIAIASRYLRAGQELRWNPIRKWISRSASSLAEAVLPEAGRVVTDPMSGYFAIRREVIAASALAPQGYKILMEVLGRGRYQRVVEISYQFEKRQRGVSKLGMVVMRDYFVQLWRLLWATEGAGRFLRYCLVGASGVAINLGLVWWLRQHDELGKLRAPAIAIEAAILNNFFWNEMWTFRDRANAAGGWRQRLQRLLRFQLVCLGGSALQLAVVWALAVQGSWRYLPTNLFAIGVATVWNYGFNITWTWKQLAAPASRSEVAARYRMWGVTAAIVILALSLRLWQLGSKSFWLDEATSWAFAHKPLWQILTNTNETNPPLYYGLLHVWMAVSGDSEVALRLLSVGFGMAAVLLTGWVGRLLGGTRFGWLAMGLMALLPLPVQYAQMARTYSLYLAVSIASFGSLYAWEQHRRRRFAIGYLISTILMGYSHYYWVFNMAAQQLYMAWRIHRRRELLRDWVMLSGVVALVMLPWGAVMATQMAHQGERHWSWIVRPTLEHLWTALGQLAAFPPSVWITLSALALTGVGWVALRRLPPGDGPAEASTEDVSRRRLLLVLWLLCPLVLPFLLSQAVTPIFRARYTIAAAPALYLLVAAGLLAVRFPMRVVTLAFIILCSADGLRGYYAWHQEDWRTLTASTERLVRPGDALIVAGTRPDPFTYYYDGQVPFEFPFDEVPARVVTRRERGKLHRRVETIVANHLRAWIVVRTSRSGDHRPAIFEAIRDCYPQAQEIYAEQFSGNLFLYGFTLLPQQPLRTCS